MKQHLFTIAVGVALMAAGPRVPQKHLEPDDSQLALLVPHPMRFQFSDYLRTLKPAFDANVRVFMVQEGTPFPESVIGLKQVGSSWRIFGAQAVAPGPAPPKPVALKTCEAAIDPALARRVIAAWDAVLLQTRPGHGPALMATDGGVRHFGSRMKDRILTGNDASYIAPDSNPAWLGKIAYDLTAICNKWKSPGGDPWTEMRHAVGQINLKSEERVRVRDETRWYER